jgi:hypothetical protein
MSGEKEHTNWLGMVPSRDVLLLLADHQVLTLLLDHRLELGVTGNGEGSQGSELGFWCREETTREREVSS